MVTIERINFGDSKNNINAKKDGPIYLHAKRSVKLMKRVNYILMQSTKYKFSSSIKP